MNRRAFLVSSFILGLNAALGNRIKPVGPTATYVYNAPVRPAVYVFDQPHSRETQDEVIRWILAGANGDCPVPGMVSRA